MCLKDRRVQDRRGFNAHEARASELTGIRQPAASRPRPSTRRARWHRHRRRRYRSGRRDPRCRLCRRRRTRRNRNADTCHPPGDLRHDATFGIENRSSLDSSLRSRGAIPSARKTSPSVLFPINLRKCQYTHIFLSTLQKCEIVVKIFCFKLTLLVYQLLV